MSLVEENKAVIRRYAEAFNRGDPAALRSLLSDDAEIQGVMGQGLFERYLVVEGDSNRIERAQMTLSNGMTMLGSVRCSAFDELQKPPSNPNGWLIQSAYIVVDDVDAHCAKALAAGARIVTQPEDQSYGGRLYSCTAPEGHLWNFGTYNPWA